MYYYPKNIAEMELAIYNWVVAELSIEAAWGHQSSPALQKPFIQLNFITHPVRDGMAQRWASGTCVFVDTLVPSHTYTLTVDGLSASYTSDSSPTLQEVRNGLIDAVTALAQGYALQEMADGAFEISGGKVATTNPNLSIKVAQRYASDGVAVLSVDVFGNSTEEAMTLIGILRTSLETDEALETLHSGGWSVNEVVGYRQPDGIAGSLWEGRAGFDVRLRCLMASIRFTDFIEFFDETSLADEILTA